MAVNLIEKLLLETVQTGGIYVEFVVSEDEIAFICNGGSRKVQSIIVGQEQK